MGRKEEDDYFFRKADLKCNHSASLSEEMDMTEREENIFGLDFSRGHSYKIAGRDTVSKKGGAKKPPPHFLKGEKEKREEKRLEETSFRKKEGAKKTSSPFSERGK